MIVQYNDYLEHYGRKGMHWYEHRFGEEDSRAEYASGGGSEQKTKPKSKEQLQNETGLILSKTENGLGGGSSMDIRDAQQQAFQEAMEYFKKHPNKKTYTAHVDDRYFTFSNPSQRALKASDFKVVQMLDKAAKATKNQVSKGKNFVASKLKKERKITVTNGVTKLYGGWSSRG